MNKKILYGLIFTSIFILSTVSMVAQPVAGATWKLGIPDAAKGMSTEKEVKVYDKDAWGEHLGYCAEDTVNEKYGGDGTAANDVGAKAKTDIHDWESADIDFFGDHLMVTDVPPNCDGTIPTVLGTQLTDYWSAVKVMDLIFEGAAYENDTVTTTDKPNIALAQFGSIETCGPISQLRVALQAIFDDPLLAGAVGIGDFTTSDDTNPDSPWRACFTANNSRWYTYVGTLSMAEARAMWGKTYKGTEVEVDTWDFVKEGDYESKPDEKDDILPILHDPHNYWDSYNHFLGFLDYEFTIVDAIVAKLEDVQTSLQMCAAGTMGGGMAPGTDEYAQKMYWMFVNATIADALGLFLPDPTTPNPFNDPVWVAKYLEWQAIIGDPNVNLPYMFIDALLNETGENPIQEFMGVPYGFRFIRPFFMDKAPTQKKEYLAMLLKSGVFAMQPVDKFLEKIIDDFAIDEDKIWGDAWIINGVPGDDDLHKGGIEVDGKVVTVTYEWAYPIYDKPTEEREDYEIVYTYSDTGGQSSTEYKGSEVFYKIESLAPVIPGYEISILLGAAAISAMALIYVVMKKKRM